MVRIVQYILWLYNCTHQFKQLIIIEKLVLSKLLLLEKLFLGNTHLFDATIFIELRKIFVLLLRHVQYDITYDINMRKLNVRARLKYAITEDTSFPEYLCY